MSQHGGRSTGCGPDGPELVAFMTKKAHWCHFLEEPVPGILVIKLVLAGDLGELPRDLARELTFGPNVPQLRRAKLRK